MGVGGGDSPLLYDDNTSELGGVWIDTLMIFYVDVDGKM